MNQSSPTDLIIVGGGPVGLVAAANAQRAGLDVVILEPRPGVIDKACGEGLMPPGVACLNELGVTVEGWPFKGIAYLDATGQTATHATLSEPGLGVRRTILHGALLRATDDIPTVTGRLTNLTQASDSVTVTWKAKSHRGELRSRYVIGADGLHSATRRSAGIRCLPSRIKRHGLRQHFAVSPWSDAVEVYWSRIGEAYVTPVAADEVGVAILTTHRAPFEALLPHFPGLLRRLDDAPPTTRVMGCGPLRQRVPFRVHGRVLLAGDAAGYVDALTGDGLALGFQQARRAVRAVAHDSPRQYELRSRVDSLGPQAAAWTLVHATRRPSMKTMIPSTAERFPALYQHLLRLATS